MDPHQLAAEPIDLTDVRDFLALDRDDISESPILTSAIPACRSRLEGVLPYYLAEREVSATFDDVRTRDLSVRLKGPVLSIERVSLWSKGHEHIISPEDYSLMPGNVLYVGDIPEPGSLTVTYRAGSYCPPVVRTALLMMVKSVYERRDEDPLSDEVRNMIYQEMRLNA